MLAHDKIKSIINCPRYISFETFCKYYTIRETRCDQLYDIHQVRCVYKKFRLIHSFANHVFDNTTIALRVQSVVVENGN